MRPRKPPAQNAQPRPRTGRRWSTAWRQHTAAAPGCGTGSGGIRQERARTFGRIGSRLRRSPRTSTLSSSHVQLQLTRGHAPRSSALVTSAPPLLAIPSRRAWPAGGGGGCPTNPRGVLPAHRPRPVVSVLQPLAARQPATRAKDALKSTPWRGPDAGRPVARRCAGATLASHSSAEQGQIARCVRIAVGNGGRGAPWAAVAAPAAVTATAASKAAAPRSSPHLIPPAVGQSAGRIGAGHSGALRRSDHPPARLAAGGSTRPTPRDILNALLPG